MNEQKPKIYKTDKWIVVEGNGKKVRFRRSSQRGILIESCMNNPTGVKEKLLELAMRRKTVVPLLSDEEQEAKIKEWEVQDLRDMVSVQSRALTLLSGGKIYIQIEENGMRMVVPKEMEKGFEVLMDLVNPENTSKRMGVRGEKLQCLNDFFGQCGLDLRGTENEDGLDFQGSGTKQLAQFMKSCAGYDIKSADLF